MRFSDTRFSVNLEATENWDGFCIHPGGGRAERLISASSGTEPEHLISRDPADHRRKTVAGDLSKTS
jgi:hypothetical protein